MTTEQKPPFRDAADAVADAHDGDVLFINAPIYPPLDAKVLELCRRRRRRKNVVLILVTTGGSADAAFRVARSLQNSYEKFVLFLTGSCKSAGTLVAIGASELLVADSGELGPLDVQMSKPDELLQRQSGLTATAALSTLHEKAFEAFEHFFLTLVTKSNSAISTRTATQIAVQLTGELFKPVYQHVDPMHVGEAGRAMQIAQQYGGLLSATAGNLTAASLERLTTGYASHDFVIDRAQIQRLFRRVRPPQPHEQALADVLGSAAIDPAGPSEQSYMAYLSSERTAPQEQGLPGQQAEDSNDQDPVEPQSAAGADVPSNEGGATPAGDPGTPTASHVATIRQVGPARRGRNSRAS